VPRDEHAQQARVMALNLSDRINKLPKWAHDYIQDVKTFVGAPEVKELMQLRDEQRQLIKLIRDLKTENRLLQKSSSRHSVGSEKAVMDDVPPLVKAPAKRSSGVLEVICPACRHVNQFPELNAVIIFVCHECGQPIEAIEPVQ
jgi:hypothetical protein